MHGPIYQLLDELLYGFVMGWEGADATIRKIVSVHATHLQSNACPPRAFTFFSVWVGAGGEEEVLIRTKERTPGNVRRTTRG